MKRQKVAWLIGVCLLVLGDIASAQVTTGTISGVVKDSSGAVIPGVPVVLLNEDTGISRTVPTDSAGRYSASTLTLGTYRVTATQQGFQTEIRTGIVLTVGREAVVDLTLAVGTVTQTTEVAGEASTLETQSATVSGMVEGETMRDLPLNGRSYVDLATLTPGVYMETSLHSDPTSGYGERLTVNGSRYDQNVYLVDGTYANTANGNTSGVGGESLGVEAFREFRVLTHNFSAEYGHSVGGVISVVTRSGTNQLHGTLYEFVRNNVFDARSFFNVGPDPPFRRNQFGGAAGGAIKKDRIFFFGNYESLHERLGQTEIAAVPDANARLGLIPNATTGQLQLVPGGVSPKVVPYLALWPLPNGPSYHDGNAVLNSPYSQPTTENYYMGRMDFRLSDKDNLYWRYIDDRSSLNQSRPVPIFAVGDVGNSHLSVLGETHVFSPTKLNEFLFSFNRTLPAGVPVQLTKQDLSSLYFVPGTWFGNIKFSEAAAGAQEIGNNPSVPYTFTTNIFTTGDNFTWVRGAHSLKVGVTFERHQYNSSTSGDYAGAWVFGSVTGLLEAQPTQQLIGFVNSTSTRQRSFRNDYFAWYIQDDYRVNSRLTLNLGLRQEFFTPPQEQFGRSADLINVLDAQSTIGPSYEPAKANFGPRVGLGWDPTGSGKTAVRLGAGVYFDQIETGPNDYRFYTAVVILPPNINFPGPEPTSAPAGTLAEGSTQFHLPTPTSIHFGLDVQRQLTRTISLQVGYVGSHSYHLTSVNNVDPRTPQTCPCAAAPSLPAGYFPYFPLTAPNINPNFGTVSETEANTIANYNALQMMLQKNVGGGLTFRASYAYSKAMSEYDGNKNGVLNTGSAGILNLYNVGQDYALSAYDQRNTFLFNSLYQMPWDKYLNSRASKAFLGGWMANVIWTYGSGNPININLASNDSQDNDPNIPDRPNLLPGFSNNPTNGVTAGCSSAIPAGTQLHTPNLWFNPCAFGFPTAGTFGNLGRDTVSGPDYNQVNFSMVKRTSITERIRLEFRAEAFNLFNHASFGVPVQKLFNSSGAHIGTEGVITTTTAPGREIQFGMKLTF